MKSIARCAICTGRMSFSSQYRMLRYCGVTVHEIFALPGAKPGDPAPAPIVATNVYLRTAAGWRMIVHHASPAPAQGEPPAAAPAAAPKILH